MIKEARLDLYIDLIRQYAGTLDLVSPKKLEGLHDAVAEALEFSSFLPAHGRVLDVGSGSGLPAIPLAIQRPELSFSLVEIRSKRAAFLERAVSILNLNNVAVYNADVRTLAMPHETVTALWVTRLDKLFSMTSNCLAGRWNFVIKKGDDYQEEIGLLEKITPIMRVHVKHSAYSGVILSVEGEL
jgi:16S rRNA (guanine527-N7)-methyltransferase